ncbi:MAG: hypothetical protein ACI814_002244 [Mariniblastus sp.]|jgi:hypothetical protein
MRYRRYWAILAFGDLLVEEVRREFQVILGGDFACSGPLFGVLKK